MHPDSSLPNPEICKTQLVYDELWECLVKYAFRCPHAIRFGSGYYCDHADRCRFDLRKSKEYTYNHPLAL
jgi:hypothetical protein